MPEGKLNMQPFEILKDLFFIERGYLNANHFVYRSGQPILIDTAYIADFAETAGFMAQLDILTKTTGCNTMRLCRNSVNAGS